MPIPEVTPGTLYIDGAWQAASSGTTFRVVNPATGEGLAWASAGDAGDARRAVDAATAASGEWASRTAYERSAVLTEAYRLLRARADELAELMSTEQGKPLRAARAEVGYAADFLLWFAEEAKRMYGMTIPSARSDQRFLVMHQPIGVAAAITPWNYPISMITRKVAPALAAGCTVVLKPAEQTPLCAVAVFRVLEDAGLPPGVANLVTAEDPGPVGEEFLTNPDVGKITFTGSTEVGKHIAERAARSVKRVSLELGGHAPFIVFDDVDVKRAAKGASLVKILNTGQACICPNRMYVHRSKVDEFAAELTANFTKFRAGSGLTEGVSVGPLIDEPALKKMQDQVADAVDKGAVVRCGGHRLSGAEFDNGYFFAPTVLTGVTPEMVIYREETFGPIAAVVAFDSEREVVQMANDTAYGLASYVYTNDLSRATRVSEALRFAIVGVNDINPTAAAAPFGGMKQSGIGREGGPNGLLEYLETKLVGISVAAAPASSPSGGSRHDS